MNSRILRALNNSNAWLKDLKNINELEKCPLKYKIKIIDLLYNLEICHNFYLKVREEFPNHNSIYLSKKVSISIKDYSYFLLFLNEVLFNNLEIRNKKISLLLNKFDYEPLSKFVRINTNMLESLDEKNDLIKNFNLKESCIENVYELDKSKLVDNDKLIIQSFSSCLPAYILNPEKNSVVLDACAAPGNKTNYLSCLMENKGKIYAFEKNEKRFKILKCRLENQKSKNIDCLNSDFMECEIKADYILLDPSCSGSGMKTFTLNNKFLQTQLNKLNEISVTKLFRNNDKKIVDVNFSNKEIEELVEAQLLLLEKSMSLNPKKIVYSTCSVFEIENEKVIEKVLKKFDNFEVEEINFEKIKENNQKKFIKKGLEKYSFGEKCVRIYPSEIHTGFFVCSLINKNKK